MKIIIILGENPFVMLGVCAFMGFIIHHLIKLFDIMQLNGHDNMNYYINR